MANLPRSMTLQTHPSLQPATQASHHPITMARQWNTSLVPGPVTIPFLYRLTITTIEPLFALTGVVQAVRYPSDYMSVMTRGLYTREAVFTHPTGRRVGVFRLCGGGGAACRPRRRRAAVAIPDRRYVAQRLGLVPLSCTGRWRLDAVGQLGSVDGSGSLDVLDFGPDSGDEDLHCSSYVSG